MIIEPLALDGAKLISLTRIPDNRGWFSETFKQSWSQLFGISTEFVFECRSYNHSKGTLRGLHSQLGELAPAKLIQVLTGSIQDVIVDARQSSPSYGQWQSVILTADDPKLLFVPRGFYHGFMTLEDHTHVSYKVDQYRDGPEVECGVAWDDPILDIKWRKQDSLIISDRDRSNPSWELAAKF